MDESSWLQNEVSGLSVVGKNARVFALDNNERDSSGDPGYSGRCGFAHLLPGMLELPCSREGRPVPATGCLTVFLGVHTGRAGAKALVQFGLSPARLKSCPDTRRLR